MIDYELQERIWLDRAKATARQAYDGMIGLDGKPYIEHVARVASACAQDARTEAAAWLFRAYADAGRSGQDAFEGQYSVVTLVTCSLLDRSSAISLAAYIQRIGQSRAASEIKLAELRDIIAPGRLSQLDDDIAARILNEADTIINALRHM